MSNQSKHRVFHGETSKFDLTRRPRFQSGVLCHGGRGERPIVRRVPGCRPAASMPGKPACKVGTIVVQSASERIRSGPVPFAYSPLRHRTASLYCGVLPFGFAGSLGRATPLLEGVVAFTFFGLDALAPNWRNLSAGPSTTFRGNRWCGRSRSTFCPPPARSFPRRRRRTVSCCREKTAGSPEPLKSSAAHEMRRVEYRCAYRCALERVGVPADGVGERARRPAERGGRLGGVADVVLGRHLDLGLLKRQPAGGDCGGQHLGVPDRDR